MSGILYKITNNLNGKVLVGTFDGSLSDLQAQVTLAALGQGQYNLTIAPVSSSANPRRAEQNYRAQSYLQGMTYLLGGLPSLFDGASAPAAPPVSTIPPDRVFLAGDYSPLVFVRPLQVQGELEVTTGLMEDSPS